MSTGKWSPSRSPSAGSSFGSLASATATVKSRKTSASSPEDEHKSALEHEEKQTVFPYVRALSTGGIDLSDDCPPIQGALAALDLEISSFFNQLSYADHVGFQTNMGGMLEHLAALDNLVEQGKGMVSMLYTYRMVSREGALPQFVVESGADDAGDTESLKAQKLELCKKQLEILRPEITKIKDLISFLTLASDRIAESLGLLVKLLEGGPALATRAQLEAEAPGGAESRDGGTGSGQTNNYAESTTQQASVVPEVLYDALLRLLDCIIIISEVKDHCGASEQPSPPPSSSSSSPSPTKESLASDCRRYRELKSEVKGAARLDDFEDQLLQDFLDKNVFDTLVTELQRVEGFEKVVVEMLHLIIDRDTNAPPLYATPAERFSLARCLPHLLVLLDLPDSRSSAFDHASAVWASSKRPSKFGHGGMKPFEKFCKRNPVVPVIGDLNMVTLSVLKRALNFENNKAEKFRRRWGEPLKRLKMKFKSRFLLAEVWPGARDGFEEYCARFALLMNRLERSPFSKELNERAVDLASQVFEMVQLGLSLLSSWTGSLQGVMAWKMTHPRSLDFLFAHVGPDFSSKDGWEYEQRVRHNFSADELSLVVDLVSMIKALQGLLAGAESTLAPIVRFHIHHRVQQLVQGDLMPLLHRVDKRQRPGIDLLLQARSLAADWLDGIEPREDYKLYRRSKGEVHSTHPPRVVPPRPTQLTMLRALLHTLVGEHHHQHHHKGAPSLFAKRDVEKHELEMLQAFVSESLFFPHALNLGASLRQCGDLSFLWLREVWLERTRCIQFPIEMSMPWILTEHVVSRRATGAPMLENLLYVLDLYNDAAGAALHGLARQHLYDEVEAEANVAVEQLVYLLSDEVYGHYKDVAAAQCLEKTYKFRMEEAKGRSYLSPPLGGFEALLRQRHVALLGRTVNLSFLVGQVITSKLAADADIALKRLESCDPCCLVEMKEMLAVLRRTHELLSQGNLLQLDSFDDIWAEADQAFSPTIRAGRMCTHLGYAILQDLFGNFAYNSYTQRFTRASVLLRTDVEYSSFKRHLSDAVFGHACSKAYRHTSELHKGFFGRAHIEALLSVCNSSDRSALISDCLSYLDLRLRALGDVTSFLCQPGGLPNFCLDLRLPGSSTVDVFEFFNARLGPLLKMDDLKIEVMQLFREVGNCLYFLRDLSACLAVEEEFRFVAVAPLLALTPDTPADRVSSSVASSPLVATVAALAAAAENTRDGHQLLMSKSRLPDLQRLCSEVVESLLSALPTSSTTSTSSSSSSSNPNKQKMSVFSATVAAMGHMLTEHGLRQKWRLLANATASETSASESAQVDGDAGAAAALLYSEADLNPERFVHLWSSLAFLFNAPNPTGAEEEDEKDEEEEGRLLPNDLFKDTTDLEVFGHGFSFAGCLLLHLLGQATAYEISDYSYEILRLRKYEETLSAEDQQRRFRRASEEAMEAVNVFVDAAQAQKDLHDHSFALCRSLSLSHTTEGAETDPPAKVRGRKFVPPAFFAD